MEIELERLLQRLGLLTCDTYGDSDACKDAVLSLGSQLGLVHG